MMFCSGTSDRKHPTRRMKYYHTSDGCTHWACPDPGCCRVTTVCRSLPPPWIRKKGYTPKPLPGKKKSSLITRFLRFVRR